MKGIKYWIGAISIILYATLPRDTTILWYLIPFTISLFCLDYEWEYKRGNTK